MNEEEDNGIIDQNENDDVEYDMAFGEQSQTDFDDKSSIEGPDGY